jgi:HlyD family secretion protein
MKKILLVLLAIAILIGVVAFYFFREREDAREIVLFGNVDVRQVDIGFRVAGQVKELLFEEGDLVCPGQLMARVDRTPYDSQLLQAQAQAESIRANLANAEILLKRRQELIHEEGVSQEDVDDALSNRNVLKANLDAAEANVQVAKDNLVYTEAFAPTEGIILTRIREPGTVVNPSDPVYTLSVSSPVWIRAFVSEPDLGRVFFGMEAKIYTDTPHAPVYTGRIGFISPVAEFTPKTVQTTQLRTDLVYRLRIYVDNPDGILKQGMPVTVRLHDDQHVN